MNQVSEQNEPIDERSDTDLLALARTGDTLASDVLWVRTWPSALAVARFVADDPADAEDLASEAMAAVFGALSRGAGPTDVVRAYVGTTIRNLHATDLRRRARDGRPVELDDERVLRVVADEPDVVESGVVSKAFRGLPDRWRYVLWATLVEGRDADDVAASLEIKSGAVYALKARALEGLRQQYLTEHALQGHEQECAAVHRSLASTVRGRNRRDADTQRVWQHLRSCTHCAEGYREMTALNTKLGALVGPAVGGLALLGTGHAKLTLLEGLRMASSGARYGVAAAGVAGAVAVSTAVIGIHQQQPSDAAAMVPSVPSRSVATTPAAPRSQDISRAAPKAGPGAPRPTAAASPAPPRAASPVCDLTGHLVARPTSTSLPELDLADLADGAESAVGPDTLNLECSPTVPVALPTTGVLPGGSSTAAATGVDALLPTAGVPGSLVPPALKNLPVPSLDPVGALPTSIPGLPLK
ncbi:MAG: polymerase, sigma-24 subunit, subfamily [Marmoricola sp.]|nr:polymerase, sigma-24 subunit, subfamily [Marmoricola sp.]